MKLDIHCHAVGKGSDINAVDSNVYLYPEDNQHWFTRVLYNLLDDELKKMEVDLNRDGIISTEEYLELVYRLLATSEEIDGVVLLALDALFSPLTGCLDKKKTDIWVSNRFLSQQVLALNSRLQAEAAPERRKKKFFFGASVNPNRKDWETELGYVVEETEAVLLKLIPSTQHIDIGDARHTPFYKALYESKMPLLCHVGPEYSFPEGIRNRRLDDYRRLRRPLECGVRVIAAHCASPVFPVADRNVMKDFYRLMTDYNAHGDVRLWADTSALSLSTRIPYVREIVETFNPEWLVNGSDFPIPVDGWTHLPLVTHGITTQEYIGICKTKNPLDRDIRIKRAHGFSETISENAGKVLRLKKL